jgi:hypothetical protein
MTSARMDNYTKWRPIKCSNIKKIGEVGAVRKTAETEVHNISIANNRCRIY